MDLRGFVLIKRYGLSGQATLGHVPRRFSTPCVLDVILLAASTAALDRRFALDRPKPGAARLLSVYSMHIRLSSLAGSSGSCRFHTMDLVEFVLAQSTIGTFRLPRRELTKLGFWLNNESGLVILFFVAVRQDRPIRLFGQDGPTLAYTKRGVER